MQVKIAKSVKFGNIGARRVDHWLSVLVQKIGGILDENITYINKINKRKIRWHFCF